MVQCCDFINIEAEQWRNCCNLKHDAFLQKVDAPTQEILNSFDLGNPGHTLIMPKNVGVNYQDFKRRDADILATFQIDPALTTPEVATEVCCSFFDPQSPI